MKRFLPLLVIFFLSNSCFDQNDCLITSTNLVKIDITTLAGVAMNATFNIMQQDSLGTGIHGPRDSVVEFPYFEKRPISSFELPLDPERLTSYYTFLTADSLKFHLTLQYTEFSRVISTDCGAFLYYKDLTAKSDSVLTQVTEPQLFKSVVTNLKILF